MKSKKNRNNLTNEEYSRKMEQHKARCEFTYGGKSGSMESKAAEIIWSLSEEKLKMRYVGFIGDGDSSAYSAVTSMNNNTGPYKDVKVEKHECINHVSKRLGTRLRKLKAEEVEHKETKTGKKYKKSVLSGKNKLTDFVIDKLTRYYGQSIRRNVNKTIEEMRRDTLAKLYHCSSTDEKPQHELCPVGESSWCFYQRDITKKNKPEHSKMKIYFRLSDHAFKNLA